MSAPAQRGSAAVLENLFGQPTVSHEQLQAAVSNATLAGLAVKRIWWKGQPVPDLIRAETLVKPDAIQSAMANLLKMHNEFAQITVEVFPIGVVQIEEVRLDVTVNRNVNR
jgi:hypothetical protein